MRQSPSFSLARWCKGLVMCVGMLLAGLSVQAQCDGFFDPDGYFDVYKTYPSGTLCSPGNVTLRAEYYRYDPYTYVSGEFRWYTSETAPTPVQTNYVYSDYGPMTSDYTLYAENGTTVWVSFYNANTGCESNRMPYSIYIGTTAYLGQEYGRKCGFEPAKVQLTSNVSGVTFELYKLVEYYDPNFGMTQQYQYLQGNSTGYFEISDFDAADQDKYYAKVYQPGGCSQPSYYQLWFEITESSPPSISGNTTVCQGTSTTLTASGVASSFEWYNAGGTLVGSGLQFTTPTSLASSTTYQVRGVSMDGSCRSDATSVTVTVNPQPVDGSIQASATAIHLGQSVTISSSGGVGTPHYWCSSNGGESWNVFSGAYAGQYSFQHTPGAVGTYRYHLRNKTGCGFCWEVPGHGCPSFPYVDVTVYIPLTGGTISGPSSTINYNTSPGQLLGTAAGNGNCGGGYSYQWEASNNNSNFSPISGAMEQNYTPGNLTATTYYRRKVTCGGEVAYTNTVVVYVATALNSGNITSANQTINYNGTPSLISATTASGGNCSGSYSYQWQLSTNGESFADISGATGQNYQPGSLGSTTYYRRKVTCGIEVAYTNVIIISVIRPLDGGCLISGNQTVAYGNIPSPITATPASYGNCNGNYTYQWQSSTDNVYFTDIAGANSQDLSFSSSLAQTTYFQRKTTCGSEVQFAGTATVTMIDAWYSVEKSGTFTKNNCTSGGTGSQVTYTVPAGQYSSTISQADADAKAQNDVNTNGQTYANTNGYCTWSSVQKSGTFTKNNCAAGSTGSSVTYTVAAGAYTSTTSQADADAKAQNDVNTNGQTYANNNGYCTWYSVQKSGTYTKNNCSTGGTGSQVTYTVAAGAYSSTISQADADAKAQNDVNTNGQTYANNNGYCTWYSVSKSGTFTKNNCPTGGTGSQVTYSVPAGRYSSTISQADADAKAQNDVNANGQAYANNNGYCTWYNVQKSGTFTKNNCPSGTTGSSVTYTVPAGRYSSTISQADADSKAQNDVNANGQTYANNNGYCTYYSVAKSGTFTKNNCATGGTGSQVTYTVAAGAYASIISQADADAKAQNDVNLNGQTYANNNGYCTWYSAQKSGTFTKNNCINGGSGSSVTYTVPAGRYSSTLSQADADELAQNDVNLNGQTYANNNGYCTWYNDAISGYFYKQNCPSGYTPNPFYVSVAAGTYSSTYSKTDANSLAQEYAQNQANQYGSCTAPTPYARLSYENTMYYATYTTADVTVRFYSNSAGTTPVSVSNLTVNYTVNDYCASSANYLASCYGSARVLEYGAWIQYSTGGGGFCPPDELCEMCPPDQLCDINGESCLVDYYLNNGTGYTIIY